MKFNWLFWIILVCGLLGGAVLGVCWQIDEARNTQPECRSLAKVIVNLEHAGEEGDVPLNADLYGTCIEILGSPEMSRRALERVRALNPGLAEQPVEIRVARTPGSGIINILATSPETKYVRVFLDALIDEFISYRTSLREQEQGRVLQSRLNDIVTLQKLMEESISRHNRARAASPPTEGATEIERLISRLTKLRDQRDDLRGIIRKEAVAESRLQEEQELKALEQDISGCEGQIKQYSTALQELRQCEESRNSAKTRYETEFSQIEALQKQWTAEIDAVGILERATPASITLRSASIQIIASGFMGGVLGGAVGLISAFIASWRPAKNRSA